MRTLILFLLSLVFVVGVGAQESSKTYTNKKIGFSVSYPSDYKIIANPQPDSNFLGISTGKLMVEMEPIKLAKKYNGSIKLLIWSSSDSKIKCGAPTEEESIAPDDVIEKTQILAGQMFYGYSNSNDGMGGSTRVNGYRGMLDGKCWQFQMIFSQSKLTAKGDDYFPTDFSYKILNKTLYDLLASFKLNPK